MQLLFAGQPDCHQLTMPGFWAGRGDVPHRPNENGFTRGAPGTSEQKHIVVNADERANLQRSRHHGKRPVRCH